jgi:hypothetical protein
MAGTLLVFSIFVKSALVVRLPVDARPDQRRDVLGLVECSHGRGICVITNRLAVEHWLEAVDNPYPAGSTQDLLVLNVHRLNVKDDSI